MRLSDGCITGSRRAPCGCRLPTRGPGSKSPPTAPGWLGMPGGVAGGAGRPAGAEEHAGLACACRRPTSAPSRRGGGAGSGGHAGRWWDCLSDLAALREQPELFGPVASTPTAWRVLERLAQDPDGLARLRLARAHARARAWAAGGDPEVELLVIDADATLVLAHSETKRVRRAPTSTASGSPRCWRIWIAAGHPGSRWPASCGRATPPRALPMI